MAGDGILNRRNIFASILLVALPNGGVAGPNLYRASTQGAIGETSNLYLIPNGYYLDIGTNDVTGGTDKLLTASLKTGVVREYSDSSFEVTAFWRLLTPTFKAKFKTPDLERPVGRYADWAAVKTSYAKIKDVGAHKLKAQISLGINHVGNKGGKRLHRWIHELTKNRIDQLEYTNQPVGMFADGGVMLAFLTNEKSYEGVIVQHQAAVVSEHGRFMVESGVSGATTVVVRPSWWEMAFEAKIVAQHHSDVYGDDIRPYRYELSAGTRLFHYFKPTVKYVSPYLKNDPIGQNYFDFVNFIVPF